MCREELLFDPSSPDVSYLGVWSGEASRLKKLIGNIRPTYSIALDSDAGVSCHHARSDTRDIHSDFSACTEECSLLGLISIKSGLDLTCHWPRSMAAPVFREG